MRFYYGSPALQSTEGEATGIEARAHSTSSSMLDHTDVSQCVELG